MSEIFIETERLILREILSTDEKGLFELDSNPKIHTYLGNNVLEKTGLKFIETFDFNGINQNWFRITKDEWDRE